MVRAFPNIRMRYLNLVPVSILFLLCPAALAGYRVEPLHTFLNPSTHEDSERDNFSVGIDLVGETVFIGARRNDTGATDTGIVHQFVYPSGELIRTLQNPDPGAGDYFGGELAIVGDTVWVGSLFDDAPASDAGAVYVFDVSTGSLLETLYSPHPTAGGVFGYPILRAGDFALIGASGDNADGVPGGAVYRYDAESRELLATIYNPTPEVGDQFGFGIDYSDGRILISSRNDNAAGPDSGTAYLFSVGGDLLQTYVNPFPNPVDSYMSVALVGDLAAVGALDEDTVGYDSGAVYVFARESGEYLRAFHHPQSAAGARFGSLARLGEDLLVGAPASDGTSLRGGAFIFDPHTGALLRKIENPIPAVRDFFGQPFAVDDDRVLIGAWGKSPTGTFSGAAHLFRVAEFSPPEGIDCDGDTRDDRLEFTHKLSNPSPDRGDRFGSRALYIGNDLLIGTYYEDVLGENEVGAVYVYDAASGDLKGTLENPGPDPYDNFGMALAWNAETDKLYVGATSWNPVSGGSPGAVEVFDYTSGEHLQTLSSPDPVESGRFGQALAIVDGNLVVGAGHERPGGVEVGAAHLFDGSTGEYLRTFSNPTPEAGDGFGEFVAAAGRNVIVTARYDDDPATDSGSAYLFDSQTGELLQTFANPTPDQGDKFGASVAGTPHWAFIGAMDDDTAGPHNSGAVHMFSVETGELFHTFLSPNPEVWGRLLGVAVDEHRLLLGAWSDSVGAYHSGAAYLYDLCSLELLQTVVSPDTSQGDYFGQTVILSGERAMIGAWGQEQGGAEAVGAAYLYRVTTGTEPPNEPPTPPNVRILPEGPKTLDDLTCIAEGSVDPEGEEISYSYAWFRDGERLLGETEAALSHELTSKGQTLTCVVTPFDGVLEGTSDSASVAIGNTPPTAPVVRILPENPSPQDGLAVYIVTESYDADGDEIVYAFEWYESNDGVNWVRRPELSAALPFSLGEPEISSLYTQVAEHWRVVVTPVESDSIGRFAPKPTTSSVVVSGESASDEVMIQPNLSLAGTVGAPEKIDSADLLMLMSVWGATKETIDPTLFGYFFDAGDSPSSRIGHELLFSLAGQGWYREIGQ